jgi:methionyl-tRNA synthetase
MVAKSFGEIPQPGTLEPVDEAVRAKVLAAFDVVGGLLAKQRIKSAVAEAMRTVGEVNKYVTDTEPFKLKGEDQRERLATVLHTLAQCVADLNRVLAPFLPSSSNAVHAAFGGEGTFMPMPVLQDVAGLDAEDAGRGYPIVTGDYSQTPRWESVPVRVGATVVKPTPIFTKLDESVVEEELARLRDAADTGSTDAADGTGATGDGDA